MDETTLTEAIRALAIDSGIASYSPPAGVAVLQDDSKNWAPDAHRNRLVKIIHGSGQGQQRVILSNSDRLLTLNQPWVVLPDHTSAYVIVGIDTAQVLRDVFGGSIVLSPIAKASVFNTALPAAEANWLADDITPTSSPSHIRIYVCVSVAGILRVARTVGGITVVEDLNGGQQLVANAGYAFSSIPWRTGDSINVQFSVTGGTILRLLIDEGGS